MSTQLNWFYGCHLFAEIREFHMRLLRIKQDLERWPDKAPPPVLLSLALEMRIRTIWRSFAQLVETNIWNLVPLIIPGALHTWALRLDIRWKEYKDLKMPKS